MFLQEVLLAYVLYLANLKTSMCDFLLVFTVWVINDISTCNHVIPYKDHGPATAWSNLLDLVLIARSAWPVPLHVSWPVHIFKCTLLLSLQSCLCTHVQNRLILQSGVHLMFLSVNIWALCNKKHIVARRWWVTEQWGHRSLFALLSLRILCLCNSQMLAWFMSLFISSRSSMLSDIEQS